MSKLMLVALMLSIALLVCTPAPAQGQSSEANWHIACDLQDEPERLSSLSDDVRWKYYEECGSLPIPPQGFTWAEDLTLVQEGFYASPSPTSTD